MSNQQPIEPVGIDPVLKEHLEELAAIAAEIGGQTWLIRGATDARLIYALPERRPASAVPGIVAVSASIGVQLGIADAGVIVLIRFPASDGGESGIEVK